MKGQIASALLVAQVKGTAAWAWDDPRVACATASLTTDGPASLRTLLAAHFTTVGTFVPTDVDARIRHHVWVAMDTAELEAACDVVDEAATWDPRPVSARVVTTTEGALSGHDGEWLAVRAGALGRAITLGSPIAERLARAIEDELDREERIFSRATRSGAAEEALAVATILAHNVGDLSRVVEAWPRHPDLVPLRARFSRLGHPDAPHRRASFVRAGAVNKAMMARENHRFLPLRKARGLRASRDLLLPIGPWFDRWGETVATHPALDDAARADVVAALLEIHLGAPEQLGCLRGIAGIHRATRGGLSLYVPDLPARLRKEAVRGRVREALDIGEAHFSARISKRYRALGNGDVVLGAGAAP